MDLPADATQEQVEASIKQQLIRHCTGYIITKRRFLVTNAVLERIDPARTRIGLPVDLDAPGPCAVSGPHRRYAALHAARGHQLVERHGIDLAEQNDSRDLGAA